ncbi:unnamed protein product [Nippostrongylus brasiliensis]|uniref:MENTAL domain-containing protein n=1 Tax=Nippostrongylus brasiliensis TaxID=27835 RepID=A0A0N4XFX5_NIPBR|nr:unnamed protein product [Nippostrongylus brasiliensis]
MTSEKVAAAETTEVGPANQTITAVCVSSLPTADKNSSSSVQWCCPFKSNISVLINTYSTFPRPATEKDVPGLGKRGVVTKMSGRAPLLGVDSPTLSKDRRRFIIISIFDATLTTLLWLLCTVSILSSKFDQCLLDCLRFSLFRIFPFIVPPW